MSLIASILISQLVELVIGIPVALIFWPVTLFLWGVLRCIRFSVQWWLYKFPQDEDTTYELTHGHDAIFGYKLANNSTSVIPGYCVIEGKFDLDVIYKRAGQMVVGNPKLRQRFTSKLGFYCWEINDKRFDLKNHVKLVTKPEEVVTEAGLMALLEELSVTPIGDEFPGWEVLLVPSFRCSGKPFRFMNIVD